MCIGSILFTHVSRKIDYARGMSNGRATYRHFRYISPCRRTRGRENASLSEKIYASPLKELAKAVTDSHRFWPDNCKVIPELSAFSSQHHLRISYARQSAAGADCSGSTVTLAEVIR